MKSHINNAASSGPCVCPSPACGHGAYTREEMAQHMVIKHRIPVLGVTAHGSLRLKRKAEASDQPLLSYRQIKDA